MRRESWALGVGLLGDCSSWATPGPRTGRNGAARTAATWSPTRKGSRTRSSPARKARQGTGIDLATTKNVRWVRKLGCHDVLLAGRGRGPRVHRHQPRRTGAGSHALPGRAHGKDALAVARPRAGAADRRRTREFFFGRWAYALGVCSSPAVDGDRVYFVSHRCEVVCLDVHGRPPGSDPQDKRRPARSACARQPVGRAGGGRAKVVWVLRHVGLRRSPLGCLQLLGAGARRPGLRLHVQRRRSQRQCVGA